MEESNGFFTVLFNAAPNSVEASEVHAAVSVPVIAGQLVEESRLMIVLYDALAKLVTVS